MLILNVADLIITRSDVVRSSRYESRYIHILMLGVQVFNPLPVFIDVYASSCRWAV